MSKDLNKLIKQAQKMQAQVMKAQEDLKNQEVEGSAGGGMVTVKLNGANEMISIKINPEVVNKEEVEMLEDLIVAAYTNATEKLKTLSESVMGSITSGFKLPGL